MTFDPTIFKAYDIRGIYPNQITLDTAYNIGRAFIAYLGAKNIAVGRDMRVAAPQITSAFIDGVLTQGANVVDYGMIATDMLYYAVARDDFDGGAEITASHNPKEYIGLKLVRKQALPLSIDSGIGDIRDMILRNSIPSPWSSRGVHVERDILAEYIEHVISFIDITTIKPFNLALDAGSGLAGLVAPQLFDRLPCETTRLCFEIDGTFPNHEANPLLEENRRDITEHILTVGADVGIAWDGDADRCFFIDGNGEFVPGDFVTALLAQTFLLKHPTETIVYDVRASHAVKDIVAFHGGTALMNRVGHAFFKKRMREEKAIFGGEITGHYYFRDNYFADNGFIPALLLLELMSSRGETLSELLVPFRQKYFISGELNTEMADMVAADTTIDELARRYQDGDVYYMDGVSVEYDSWHFNVRASNTEPLIRLNIEATSRATLEEKRNELQCFIREQCQS